MVTSFPKDILEKYKIATLCCYIMNINDVGSINTISQHIMFSTEIIFKDKKIKNIEGGNKQLHKIYLKCGFKITCIHADSEFGPLCVEMSYLYISLNCVYRKEHIPDIEQFNRTVK